MFLKKLFSDNINYIKNFRCLSNAINKKENVSYSSRMCSWQIHSYGDLNELQFTDKARIPIIQAPNEVLIKIKTTSVNPIDVAMTKGYGSRMFNILRCSDLEFPLTLGREFSGVVAYKGAGVNNINVGDNVMGVVPIHKQGSHSEYVIVDHNHVVNQPNAISDIEAGSLFYAGLTAFSGIFISGDTTGIPHLVCDNSPRKTLAGKKVLVLGGTGGVGHIAIQILKAENAIVFTTCSENGISLVENLGADHVINYKSENFTNEINKLGHVDLVLDCAGYGCDYANKLPCQFSQYITFSSPLLRNVDSNGLPFGMILNTKSLIETNLSTLVTKKGCVKWAYFIPSSIGMKYLVKLYEQEKLKPVIEETFSFKNLDLAYQKVANGHLRGKIGVVIN